MYLRIGCWIFGRRGLNIAAMSFLIKRRFSDGRNFFDLPGLVRYWRGVLSFCCLSSMLFITRRRGGFGFLFTLLDSDIEGGAAKLKSHVGKRRFPTTAFIRDDLTHRR